MAIIRPGPIVGAVSGTLGGVVFVAARRGFVVRPRPNRLHRTSPFLSASKSFMHNLRRHWSTLTADQQNLWNTSAALIQTTNALGLSSPINGFQYFIMTNKTAFPGPKSIVDVPFSLQPTEFVLLPTVVFSVSGSYSVTAQNNNFPGFMTIQIYGWPFWRTTPSRSVARLVFLREDTQSLLVLSINVRDAWIAHFGPLSVGQQFALGIVVRAFQSPFVPRTTIRTTAVA